LPLSPFKGGSGRKFARLLLLAITFGCTKAPKRVAVSEPSDTTARVVLQIAREQLTAPDPYSLQRIQNCEISRLRHVVGLDSSLRIVQSVSDCIVATSTAVDRARVQDSLAGKLYVAEVGCDSIGAAGLLGGPWLWEVPGTLPGDTLWRRP
jgi:hypothetical protein